MSKSISEHFQRDDFSCKCGVCEKEFKISLTLIGLLEHLRVKYNQKVNILRAYICEEESKKQFGNSKDYHHLGKAVDFNVENVPLTDLFKEVEAMPEVTGLGFVPQDNHVHIDLRDKDREIWIEERREKNPLTIQKKEQYGLL